MTDFIANCAKIFHFSYNEIMYKIPYFKLLMMFTSHNDCIIREKNQIKELREGTEKVKNKKRRFELETDKNGHPKTMKLF